MKTYLSLLVATICLGSSIIALSAPPPKAPPPGPAAPGPTVLHCGTERPHPAHNWRNKKGVLFRCPGGPDRPGPRR